MGMDRTANKVIDYEKLSEKDVPWIQKQRMITYAVNPFKVHWSKPINKKVI